MVGSMLSEQSTPAPLSNTLPGIQSLNWNKLSRYMSINNTIILAIAKWSVMSDVLRLLNTEYFYSYPKTIKRELT